MKRRFITILIPVISLLTSCARNNLRSDIIEFIASFSIDLAMEHYPQGSYKRIDISIENDVTSKVITEMKMSRISDDNLAYDFSKITYEGEEIKSNIHRYIEKNEEKYFYISEDGKIEKNSEQVKALTLEFFYTSSTEGIYTGGMFMGDAFREILPDIQDLVTIDSENKLLVYSYVNHMEEENKEVTITQNISLDEYGMLVKDDLVKESDLGKFETHIEVKKSQFFALIFFFRTR